MSTEKVVNVGKIPGAIFKLPFRNNEMVSNLLKRADIVAGSGEIQVDGVSGITSTIVKAGQTILVINKIKGN